MPGLRPEDFDLRQLTVFCKIVELRSFTRAAEALFLTQPTLSARMADLERKAGVRLLDRRARDVVATKAGAILFRHARELLQHRDSAVQELGAFLGVIQGELLLGASTIPGEYLLPPIIASFKREAPQVMVKMVIADSQKVTEQARAGKVEVGIVGARPQNGDLRASKLIEDELVLIVPRQHRLADKTEVAFDEVAGEPFIDREAGSGTRRALAVALRQRNLHPDRDLHVVIEAGSTEAVKQCVEAGAGVAIVSRRAIGCEVKMGTLRSLIIRDLKLTRSFYVILAGDRTPSPVCRAFLAHLKRAVQEKRTR